MRRAPVIIFSFLLLLSRVNSIAQSTSLYTVNRLSINYPYYNEISPVIVGNGILFCSDRRFSGLVDRTSYDGKRLFNFYYAEEKDSSGWSSPREVKSERSSLFNNGPLCFTPDGKAAYFTSEIETGDKAKSRKFKNHSGIFIADFNGSELSSVRPFKYNNPDYDIGQPAISYDGKYLFFVSDMPGGSGGSDIFYCESVNGDWSTPVSLGKRVNSPGTDNYPFMHPSGRLYFTSDREGGLGGLDIWYSSLKNGEWSTPLRLPEPVNSSSDDFAFVIQTDQKKGYFTSNRKRSDDIYEFESPVIRKDSCNKLQKNSYCYEFVEENAIKYDSIPFRYIWHFGDGFDAEGPLVEHCFKEPGTYIVQLDVTNLVTNEVNVNEKSDALVIEPIEQPYISSPDKAAAGFEITFSADSTYLPGWDIEQYYWSFDDETIAIGKNVRKTYNKPGSYNVQLMVSTKPVAGLIIREACVSKNILITE